VISISADEITAYPLGSVTLGYFARTYADEGAARRARQRADDDIRPRDDTSVFRVVRPEGDHPHVLIVVSQSIEGAARVRRRIAWGGEPCSLTGDEIDAVVARLAEVAEAGQLRSRIDWSGVGGIGVSPQGSLGPLRRGQG
jgi:hypothetical protein